MSTTTTTTTRVIASKPKIGTRPAPGGPAAEPEQPEKGGKKKKPLLIAIVLVVLAGAAGAWYFLMGPGAATDEAADGDAAQVEAPAGRPEGEPGEVLTTEAISINLANGHYLRLGLGLELSATVHGDVSTAKALDAAIALFSGRPMDEVASPEGRAALKDQLAEQLWEIYHGDVLDVYFTDFVTQ